MAATVLIEISKDEHERARLRSRRMAETDRISDLLTAEERGEIKGEKKEKERTVRAMKTDGVDVNTIAKWTGLTVNEISSIS